MLTGACCVAAAAAVQGGQRPQGGQFLRDVVDGSRVGKRMVQAFGSAVTVAKAQSGIALKASGTH
jgi:hypothetical protein